MKVQSFKSIMILSVCGWGATGALAFWAGNRFGPNGTLVAGASSDAKGNQADLQKALKNALAKSTSTRDPGAPTAAQLLSLKGKMDPGQLARWAASLSPSDCSNLMADLQKQPAGAKRDAMLGALYDSWAKQDPKGFLDNAGKMTNPLARQASTAKALNAWATENPKDALAWLDKNPGATNALQNTQYKAIMAGFGANNPAEAYSYVMALPDGAGANSPQAQAKIEAMRAVLSGMAEKGNFEEVQAMIGQMPQNSQLQRQAYQQMVGDWVANSPVEAAAWIANLTSDPTQAGQSRQYANTLVQSWALTDPMAAAKWASDQDALRTANNPQGGRGGPRGGLLATAVGQMVAAGDVDQAGTYLNTLPAGPSKDSAVSAFVTGAVNEDPLGAMKWVQTAISDPNTQNRMARVVAQEWSQTDPNGFSDYVATLDPATRQTMLQAAQQAAQGGFGPGQNNGGFAQNNGGGRNGGGRNGGNGNGGNGIVVTGAGGTNNNGGAFTGNNNPQGPRIITGAGGRNGGRGGRNGGGG